MSVSKLCRRITNTVKMGEKQTMKMLFSWSKSLFKFSIKCYRKIITNFLANPIPPQVLSRPQTPLEISCALWGTGPMTPYLRSQDLGRQKDCWVILLFSLSALSGSLTAVCQVSLSLTISQSLPTFITFGDAIQPNGRNWKHIQGCHLCKK